MENKKYSMSDILDKLTGNITAFGDTRIDNEAIENIDEIEDFLLNKINQLITNSRLSFRQEDSIKRVAKRSKEVVDRIKEMINYYEEKDREER